MLYALSTAPDGLRMCDLCDDVLLTQAGISRLVAGSRSAAWWSAATTRTTHGHDESASPPGASTCNGAWAAPTPATSRPR